MSSTDYKLVIMGAGGVGKSALTIQLLQHRFEKEYDPTIEASYRKQVTIDDETCILDILDTAGQEEFTALRDSYFRSGRGFILVYSIDSDSSFKEVQKLKEQMQTVREGMKNVCVLVGNKCDLETDRLVTFQQGRSLAAEWGCPFFESSAKDRVNVDEVFFQLVREIRGKKIAAQSNRLTKKNSPCILV